MAKTSVKERQKKRILLNKKHHNERQRLKAIIRDLHASDEDRAMADALLQAKPRGSSKIQQRNRCNICGRPRGNYRKFGLCRIHLRTAVMKGDVPGTRKSSW